MLKRGPERRRLHVLFAVWLAFLARGVFYCVEQPLWEGYDEWTHFAYVQHFAELGRAPDRADPVSDEVSRSLELVPVPYSQRDWLGSRATHDEFWQLPAEERARRERELLSIRPANERRTGSSKLFTQYEAQQPPLYYLVSSPVYLAAGSLSLPGRVLVLRIFSLVIASMVIPLGYAVARETMLSRQMALLLAVLLASLPGLLIDVCRVGNESLGIVLSSAVVLASLRLVRRSSTLGDWILAGGLLGAALLTKAYALAFLPLPPLLAALQALRKQASPKQAMARCALALALSLAAAGWWYWQTWTLTRTISGEQLDASVAGIGIARKIAAVRMVSWTSVLDAAASSYIWAGGWSFFVARGWMYRVFEAIALAAVLGLGLLAAKSVLRIWRKRVLGPFVARAFIVTAACALFCAGFSYHALVVFLALGTSTALGWYLYAIVTAEVVALALGMIVLLGIKWALRAVRGICVLAAALDLFTVHFILAPYYTGLIRHRTDGSLEAFRWSNALPLGAQEVFQRLSINEAQGIGWAVIAALWAAYLLATAGLIMLALRAATMRERIQT